MNSTHGWLGLAVSVWRESTGRLIGRSVLLVFFSPSPRSQMSKMNELLRDRDLRLKNLQDQLAEFETSIHVNDKVHLLLSTLLSLSLFVFSFLSVLRFFAFLQHRAIPRTPAWIYACIPIERYEGVYDACAVHARVSVVGAEAKGRRQIDEKRKKRSLRSSRSRESQEERTPR